MEAVAWSAIGLLGASLAVLVGALLSLAARIERLGDKIDLQGRDLGERIEAQGRETRERLDVMSSRIDHHIDQHTG